MGDTFHRAKPHRVGQTHPVGSHYLDPLLEYRGTVLEVGPRAAARWLEETENLDLRLAYVDGTPVLVQATELYPAPD